MVRVIGTGITPFNRRKDGSGFRDWVAAAFAEAVAEAGLERRDIDLLVVGSESDFFTLQLNPSSVIASDLGLVGAASMRVEGGGATGQVAVHAAFSALKAGTATRAAVIGFEASASGLAGSSVRKLYGFSFDGWTEGLAEIQATALYALSFQMFARRTGASLTDAAQAAVQNRLNARDNPLAHLPMDITVGDVMASPVVSSPYRKLDCSPLSDGAAALILVRDDAAPASRRRAAKLAGIGSATDHARLGAREDPGRFAAKALAMRRACAMADVHPADIGLAEIYDPYSGAELQALEALGFRADAVAAWRDGVFAPSGSVPINLSGGLLGQGAPVGAVGVAQVATCARQLENRYFAGLQCTHNPRFAVADTHGGIATTCAVTILEAGT